ncbi:MAG TPA: ATP-binding protein [Chryseolinea sp.]|nr:ATP-binding protein [Chryseolinea sp.]
MNLSVLDNLPAPAFVIDQQNDVAFVNGEARRFEAVADRPFVAGAHFPDLVPEANREMVVAALDRARLKKEKSVLEFEYRDRKGRVSHFETVFGPFHGSDTRPPLVCVIFRETTGEKVFQKRATQLLQEYASMVESANAVIFSIDSREYLTEWNAECARTTSYAKNEALAKQLDTFVDAACLSEFRLFLDLVLKGMMGSNFELLFKTRSGDVVNVLVNATPKINNEGRVIGVLFVGHDVTELTEYRKSLERVVVNRTEKLKVALGKEKELVEIRNRFVSMASHELRIPLSTIASAAQYVRTQVREDDVIEKLDTIEKQIAHMRSLIDDVLTLGKTEGTKIKASHQRLDIVALLTRLAREVVENAQGSHEVIFKTSHPVIEMESDEKLLRNVFLNLFSNAMKFSPSHREIYVDIGSTRKNIEVSVMDKGIGIGNDDLATIFEPFSRGRNVGQIKGTGLGLSIVKRAVEVLGGSVDVQSEINEGTNIIVKFNTFM